MCFTKQNRAFFEENRSGTVADAAFAVCEGGFCFNGILNYADFQKNIVYQNKRNRRTYV